jgi:hypothetical protein
MHQSGDVSCVKTIMSLIPLGLPGTSPSAWIQQLSCALKPGSHRPDFVYETQGPTNTVQFNLELFYKTQ